MELTLYMGVFACMGLSLLLLPRRAGVTVKARAPRKADRVVPPRLLFSNTPAPVARC
jgi:hypothetical protein